MDRYKEHRRERKRRKTGKEKESEKKEEKPTERSPCPYSNCGAESVVPPRSWNPQREPLSTSPLSPFPRRGVPGLYTWPRLVKGLPQLKLWTVKTKPSRRQRLREAEEWREARRCPEVSSSKSQISASISTPPAIERGRERECTV